MKTQYQFPKSEHGLQAAFFNWVRRNRKLAPNENVRNALELCYAVPNGLSSKESQKAKMEGLTKGIPDINLDWPNSFGKHGLRIEMKYGNNKLSEYQEKKKLLLEQAGYQYEVCFSTKAAIEAVINYLPYPRKDYIEAEY